MKQFVRQGFFRADSASKVEKQVDRECLVMYNNEIVKVGVFGVF